MFRATHRPSSGAQKTVIAASGFTYVFGCRPLQWPLPETCWAIKKHWNNKFYYTVASYCFFLWDLYYDARIHDHQASY